MNNESLKITRFVVLIYHRGGTVLIGPKSVKIGQNCFMPPGGKARKGEGLVNCALREGREETGLQPINIQEVGRLTVRIKKTRELREIFTFRVDAWTGKLCHERRVFPKLFWLKPADIPWHMTMPKDKYWLLPLLESPSISCVPGFDVRVDATMLCGESREDVLEMCVHFQNLRTSCR